MKLFDRETNETIATIMTNNSMSIDDALNLRHYTVDDEGQIVTEDSNLLNAWYDNLEIDFDD